MLFQIGSNTKQRRDSEAERTTKASNQHYRAFQLDKLRHMKSETHLMVPQFASNRNDDDYNSSVNVLTNSDKAKFVKNFEFTFMPKEKKMGLIVNTANNDEYPFVNLNIGGQSFILRKETLFERKCGLLSCLAYLKHEDKLPLVDGYFEATNEYYFERQPILFHIIYQFYLTGKIHQPGQACPQDILDEFEYWGIDPTLYFSLCCCGDLENDESIYSSHNDDDIDEFKNLKFGELRRKLWKIIEEPTCSIYGRIFAIISVFFVLVSISGLILGSIPDLQVPTPKSNKNDTRIIDKEPHPILIKIEYICIIWFSFEYFSKMILSANRWKTFLQLLNIIDLFAIVPFMIEMSLILFGVNTEQIQDLKGAFLVIRILRVLRVIRVLKLGRYSSGLQMFGKTLQASFKQLGMMGMVVMTGVIFFSTLVYFLEKDEPNSGFYSIPASCWWCLVTMSTVGYGDLTPVTVAGKLVATGAIACGVLVLALPITIIVDNFMKVAESERKPAFIENSKIKRLGPRARITINEEIQSQQSIKRHKLQGMSPVSNGQKTPFL